MTETNSKDTKKSDRGKFIPKEDLNVVPAIYPKGEKVELEKESNPDTGTDLRDNRDVVTIKKQ